MKFRILFLSVFAVALSLAACSEEGEQTPVGPSTDTISPGVVADLRVDSVTGNTIALSWTAPGDDGTVGRASVYDVRYATSAITEGNFELATQVSGVAVPRVVGYPETLTVTGLMPQTKYYFALKTADEASNWSVLSNLDSAITNIAGHWTVYQMSTSDIPSDTVFSIAFKGWLKYIGTADGLAIFDGVDWTTYDTSNSSIVSDRITELVVEPSGVVWAGSAVEGLSRIENDNQFTTYNSDSTGEAIDAVRDLASVVAGEVWIATGTNGVYSYDGMTWTNLDVSDGLLYNAISAIQFDNGGGMWISYNVAYVSRYSGGGFAHFNAGTPAGGVADMAVDANGNMWFATESGVWVYDGGSWVNYTSANSGLVNNVVLQVAVDQSGDKWFGTRFGVSRLSGSVWTTYSTANSQLPGDEITTIAVDNVDNVWIGTYNGIGVFTDVF